MKIHSIDFKNYRKSEERCLLSINKQTIIVGKNNTAKTSIVEIMTKFLTNTSTFKFSDFNYKKIRRNLINELYNNYKAGNEEIVKEFPVIEMNISIDIDENDNLALIKDLIYEFDNNNTIIIKCEFSLDKNNKIFIDYETYNEKFKREEDKIDFYSFFEREFYNYYSKKYFSSKPESTYLNSVDTNYIYNLFNLFVISAQREVDDISDNEKMTLSNAIWKFYQEKKKKNTEDLNSDDLFREAIENIKDKLDDTYANYFSELIKVLNEEIVNDDKDKKLNIVSDFDIENLLKKNSKVKYFFDDIALSESSNGLGYSNLLYIYIQIEAFKFDINTKKAVFNMVFLEEPESHLHPQMQSVFLSKINKIFNDGNIYSIISTHSAYILQSSDINDINYFLNTKNGLKIKSLRSFINQQEYSGLKNIIDKYFILNTCDLFFADKVIFLEGMAERIMLPYFFAKYDSLNDKKISSQHIAIFEVGGRHAYIFQDLVKFLEIKSLTITDLDSVVGNHNKSCPCDLNIKDLKTTNPTIKNWFGYKDKTLFVSEIKEKYLSITSREKSDDLENSLITFQLPQKNEMKWGRTLEEQFLLENKEWIVKNINDIESLQNAIQKIKKDYNNNNLSLIIDSLTKEQLDQYCYEIIQEIEKSAFSLDVILLDGWKVPSYIMEGLQWLAK